MKKAINGILANPKLKHVVAGINVVDLDNGSVIYSRNADRLFSPASNMKLVTTAAALHLLGPDYTFRTSIYRSGPISGGVLHGDLIVRGSGDPNVSGRFYGENITAIPDMWAQTLREVGITEITGDIVGDDRIFDREFINPYWPKDQLTKWYCAPICGLSFNDNCVEVEIAPGAADGEPAKVSSLPPTSYVVFENKCVTTSRERDHLLIIDRGQGEAQIKVDGRCWTGAGAGRYFVTVDNPAMFLLTVFAESLEKAGIKVKGKPRLTTESLESVEVPSNEIAACAQHKLADTIAVTNRRSQNFYAEQLLRLIGHKMRGEGSSQAGISACAGFLKQIGIAPESYRMVDGCGLASENRMTPGQFTRLLHVMWHHKYNKDFAASLARPGGDGSLRSRFREDKYRERICAKTGYIDGVSSLSGYLSTDSGRMYAFSILMNDPRLRGFRGINSWELRSIQDEICKALIDS